MNHHPAESLVESGWAVAKPWKTVVVELEPGMFGGCTGEPVDEIDLESGHVAIDEDSKIPAGGDPAPPSPAAATFLLTPNLFFWLLPD